MALQATVEHDRGWHYVQRITHNLWLYPRGENPFKPHQLNLHPGQPRTFVHVRVTQKHAGPAHFVAYWAQGEKEPGYLLSDHPISLQTLHVYRRRFWTEPMSRDFKSYGWNLEASRLRDPKRLERLLLGIALAYVWLIPADCTTPLPASARGTPDSVTGDALESGHVLPSSRSKIA